MASRSFYLMCKGTERLRIDALVGVMKALKDFLIGFTPLYVLVQEQEIKRLHHEYAFMVVTLGEFVGLPMFPPYYVLRLLPYWVDNRSIPSLRSWRIVCNRFKEAF